MQRIRLNIFICLTKKDLFRNKTKKTKQKMQSLNKSLKGFGLQLQPQLLCNHAIRGHCNYSMLSITKWQLRCLISHVIASVSLQIFCTDTFLFFVMDHLIFPSLPFFSYFSPDSVVVLSPSWFWWTHYTGDNQFVGYDCVHADSGRNHACHFGGRPTD